MSYRWLWVCALLIVCVSVAPAQTSGNISGVVRDTSGGIIAGASLVVRNMETGSTRTLPTDAQGRFHAANLTVGAYEVEASMEGFRRERRSGIHLTVAQEAVVNFTLQLGQVAETVEVTGEAPLVETGNATLTGLVDQQTITELPLNGRSFDQLMQLQVGTVNARQNQGTTALGGGTKISISGVRPNGNSFLLDGTDINDSRNATPGGASALTLGVDTVREFRVLTNSYSAEYGRSSGGVLTAVTKSGTNELHGTVFEFLRNDKLDANLWESAARGNGVKAPFRRNQFGFTVGGPIQKNKTFFFGSYEGLRDRLGGSPTVRVPTARARQGFLPLGIFPPSTPPEPANPGERFLGVAPGVKPWLDLYPLPNGKDNLDGTGEFGYVSSQPTNQNYFTVRGDHSFSAAHSIFARYTSDRSERKTPLALPFDSNPQSNRNQYLTVQFDSVITATSLNTARFGMNKSHARETLGTELPENMTFVPGVPFTFGGLLNIANVANIGNYLTPRGVDYSLFEISDDVTLIRAGHTLKMGAILKNLLDFQEAVTARAGRYILNGGLTDALQGRATTLQIEWPGLPGNRDWRQKLVAFYLQDDFKLKSNLTVNLGVREEFMTSPTEVDGKCANLEKITDTTTSVGCPLFETFKSNWAPRVGFAWDTRSNSRFVLRGGWGIFYDQPFSTYWRVIGRSSPPFSLPVTFANASFPNHIANVNLSGAPPAAASLSIRNIEYTGTTYAMQYNFNLQSELRPGTGITLGYIGSQSKKLIVSGNRNVNGFQILPDGSKRYVNTTRRNPAWGNITTASTSGGGNYDAFVASVQQRFRNGLRVQGSYTFGKTISQSDTVFGTDFVGDAAGGLMDANDPGRDRGLASYGIKHNLTIHYNYELPFRAGGVAGKLITGWQLSGIISRQSGIPFSAGTATTATTPGDGVLVGQAPAYRPDLLPGASNNPTSGQSAGCGISGTAGSVTAGTKVGTPDLYFDPCAFAAPNAGFYGNLGRHTLTGPGLVNFDFSLLKDIPLSERINLQFRAEMFNIMNHPNFNYPVVNVFSAVGGNLRPTANRGRLESTNTAPRQVQFALKLVF